MSNVPYSANTAETRREQKVGCWNKNKSGARFLFLAGGGQNNVIKYKFLADFNFPF